MKTISIRELHARTGKWVRQAAGQDQILVADNGRPVVRMVPAAVHQPEDETMDRNGGIGPRRN